MFYLVFIRQNDPKVIKSSFTFAIFEIKEHKASSLWPLRPLSQGQSHNRQDHFKAQGSIYWLAGLCISILAPVPQGPEVCNQFTELGVLDDSRSPDFHRFTTEKHL